MNHAWQVGDVIELETEAWEVRKVLRGGMGFVYIVYERARKELRAAKTLQQTTDPVAAQMFLRECKAWLNVGRHENIVEAVFVRRIQNQPFLFLEFVSGGDLAAWIGTPALLQDRSQLLLFAVQCCDALDHALTHGIHAHRDIKPANCLVTSLRTLKVTDFGLAAIRDAIMAARGESRLDVAPPPPSSRMTDRIADWMRTTVRMPPRKPGRSTGHETRTGTGGGTPPYMAPEQFADMKHVDVRADVYSFGIMLFQMTSGRLPFVAHDLETWFSLHQSARPPRLPDDPPLDAIVQKCLAKRPADRFGSFAEIRDELARSYRSLTGSPPPAQRTGEQLEADDWFIRMINFSDLGMMEEAEECFEQLRALKPDWIGGKGFLIPRLTRRGVVFDYTPEAERANLLEAEAALREKPGDRDALTLKGVSLLHLGNLDHAVASFDRALHVDGVWAPAWLNKGFALGRLGRLREALTCFDAAVNFAQQTDQWLAGRKLLELRALVAKGRLEIELERFEDAVETLDRALAQDPESAEAWVAKGAALEKLGRDAEALPCLARAADLEPTQGVLWINLALVLRKLGQTGAALDSVERAIAAAPGDPQAWWMKSSALAALERYDEAIAALEEAARLGQPDTDVVLQDLRARASQQRVGAAAYAAIPQIVELRRSDRYDDAIVMCEEVLKTNRTVTFIWFLKGDSELKLGRFEDALTSLNEAAALEPYPPEIDAQIWKCTGDTLARLGRDEEAVDAYDVALRKDPSAADVWVARGKVLLNLGRVPEARAGFEQAKQLGDTLAERMLAIDLDMVSGAMASRREATEAIAVDPSRPAPYVNRGIARITLGDWDGAIADLTHALALDPSNADAYYKRGHAKHGKRDFAGAIRDYSEALARNPDNPAIYGDRGGSKLESGDFAGAIADCTRAIELKPNDLVGHINRGLARFRMGGFDAAIEDCARAIEIDPANGAAHEILRLAKAAKDRT